MERHPDPGEPSGGPGLRGACGGGASGSPASNGITITVTVRSVIRRSNLLHWSVPGLTWPAWYCRSRESRPALHPHVSNPFLLAEETIPVRGPPGLPLFRSWASHYAFSISSTNPDFPTGRSPCLQLANPGPSGTSAVGLSPASTPSRHYAALLVTGLSWRLSMIGGIALRGPTCSRRKSAGTSSRFSAAAATGLPVEP